MPHSCSEYKYHFMSWCFSNLELTALGEVPTSQPGPEFWNETQHLPVPSYSWLLKKKKKTDKQPPEF